MRKLCLLLMVVAAVSMAMPVNGGVVYVDDSATGANNGTSWASAYVSLQTALTAAGAGTEIRVAQGLYRPTTGADRNIAFVLKNGVTIKGGYAGALVSNSDQRHLRWYPSVLCGNIGTAAQTDNSYTVVVGSGTDDTAVLDGFVIQNGYAEVNVSNPTPQSSGGGIFLDSGRPVIRNCRIQNHKVRVGGAGLCNINNSSPRVENCQFVNNEVTTGSGGAILNYGGSAVIRDCQFIGNKASSYGGAIYNIMAGQYGMVLNCFFAGNIAFSGGGIFDLYSSNNSLINCVFSGNVTTEDTGNPGNWGLGGGMVFQESSTRVINCSFTRNFAFTGQGGGIVVAYSTARTPTLTNCIVWNNSGGDLLVLQSIAPTVTYSDIQGGYTGPGNKNVDPQFVDADGPDNVIGTADDNLRLKSTSPCIDVASNPAMPADWIDMDGDGDTTELFPLELDGNPRFWDCPGVGQTGKVIDMGAYEWHAPWDIVVDGKVNMLDLARLQNAWAGQTGSLYYDGRCDINTLPDGKVDALDLRILADHWLGN